MVENIFSENWQTLVSFLPQGWQAQAKTSGALTRRRKFTSPEKLLRVLFIHLAEGCSLRATAAIARSGKLANVSDVALLKRLKAAGEWFRSLAAQLMAERCQAQPLTVSGRKLNLKIVDASSISEPGATGTTWRIHYAVALPSLNCCEVQVTDPKVGESFQHFAVAPGDVFLGDRGYYQRSGIAHVVKNGGDVVLRVKHEIPVYTETGEAFNILTHLQTLGEEPNNWDVQLPHENGFIRGRICALKKSEAAAAKARLDAIRVAKKKGHKVKPKTLLAAGYIIIFTTLREVSAGDILEIYRRRWQVELAFKRLKSLLGLGHLRKTDVEGAKAWLHGKLLVAFLLEAMLGSGETFSPGNGKEAESLAGNDVYAGAI